MFAGIAVWALVRYGFTFLLAKLTVHRGMFHSIPALLIAAELMFLVYPSPELRVRILMSLGVGVGFLSHLLLDEVYSVQWDGARVRLAKSAGSALKVWGDDALPNGVAMGLLLVLTWAVLLKLEVVRDPARIPAPEMYDMTTNLQDAAAVSNGRRARCSGIEVSQPRGLRFNPRASVSMSSHLPGR
ncbi:MAG UNVERIFIED_CONTAM: metal-dependent hydrolase [Planctomycetaceae bacterium]|jgi:hypothetical protein